jgi:hypothetical protein
VKHHHSASGALSGKWRLKAWLIILFFVILIIATLPTVSVGTFFLFSCRSALMQFLERLLYLLRFFPPLDLMQVG